MKNAKRELKDSFSYFSFFYTENGVVTYDKNLNLIHQKSMKELLGKEKYDTLIKYLLDYIDKAELPYRVGNYLDERSAVINVSVVGNPVTKEQREEYKLRFTKGGIKSFDIFPKGWDKTYCLQFIEGYDNILFFGDNTYPGGADYDLAISDKITKGIAVKGPDDTIIKVNELLKEIDSLN